MQLPIPQCVINTFLYQIKLPITLAHRQLDARIPSKETRQPWQEEVAGECAPIRAAHRKVVFNEPLYEFPCDDRLCVLHPDDRVDVATVCVCHGVWDADIRLDPDSQLGVNLAGEGQGCKQLMLWHACGSSDADGPSPWWQWFCRRTYYMGGGTGVPCNLNHSTISASARATILSMERSAALGLRASMALHSSSCKGKE